MPRPLKRDDRKARLDSDRPDGPPLDLGNRGSLQCQTRGAWPSCPSHHCQRGGGFNVHRSHRPLRRAGEYVPRGPGEEGQVPHLGEIFPLLVGAFGSWISENDAIWTALHIPHHRWNASRLWMGIQPSKTAAAWPKDSSSCDGGPPARPSSDCRRPDRDGYKGFRISSESYFNHRWHIFRLHTPTTSFSLIKLGQFLSFSVIFKTFY